VIPVQFMGVDSGGVGTAHLQVRILPGHKISKGERVMKSKKNSQKQVEQTVSCYNCKFRIIDFYGYSRCRLFGIPAKRNIKCNRYIYGDEGVNPYL